MGFSKKGKRKIIYNEEIFYWFVKRDEDYGTDYLNIIKEESGLFNTQKLFLYYYLFYLL